jgi:hypothetical protein
VLVLAPALARSADRLVPLRKEASPNPEHRERALEFRRVHSPVASEPELRPVLKRASKLKAKPVITTISAAYASNRGLTHVSSVSN